MEGAGCPAGFLQHWLRAHGVLPFVSQRELSGQLARTGCFAPAFLLMQEISVAFHITEEAPGLRVGFGLSLESRWRAAGDFWWLNLPCKEPQISTHSLWWGQCAIRAVLGSLGRATKRKGSPAVTFATLAVWFNYASGAKPKPSGIGEEGNGASLSVVVLGPVALYECGRRELLSPKVSFFKHMA